MPATSGLCGQLLLLVAIVCTLGVANDSGAEVGRLSSANEGSVFCPRHRNPRRDDSARRAYSPLHDGQIKTTSHTVYRATPRLRIADAKVHFGPRTPTLHSRLVRAVKKANIACSRLGRTRKHGSVGSGASRRHRCGVARARTYGFWC